MSTGRLSHATHSGGTRPLATGARLAIKKGPGGQPEPLALERIAIMTHSENPVQPVCVPVSASGTRSPDRPDLPAEVCTTCSGEPVLTGQNPPPLSHSPYEVVVAEPVLIGQLVKLYGWRVIEPGLIRRCRKVAP